MTTFATLFRVTEVSGSYNLLVFSFKYDILNTFPRILVVYFVVILVHYGRATNMAIVGHGKRTTVTKVCVPENATL